MAYVHRERTWESFINKLNIKRSNLSLDAIRVFTFFLNLDVDYKSIYLISMHLYLASLFLGFFLISLVISTFFSLRLDWDQCWLQLLFIGFHRTTSIWTMRWSWPLDVWRILINPIRRWSHWFRRILDPLRFWDKNLHWIEIESYSYSTWKENQHLKKLILLQKCPV